MHMAAQLELVRTLTKLGLKESEVSTYLSVLEQGQSTILAISKATNIKRGTVYEITNRLIDRGFLKVTFSEKKRYFIAEDPRILTSKYREYTDALMLQLPQLLALQNAKENKPKITFYEGEDEVMQIYEDTLRTGQPIFSYTSVLDIYNLLSTENIEGYIKARVAKKIPVKIIALDSHAARLWSERGEKEFREIRLIPKEQYDFSADVEIYDNKVAIVSFKEDVFGIMIESEQISQMMRSAFNLMWQASTRVKDLS